MNIFKFHNVGQGLFYTGSIDDGKYNFIYDCGSISSGNSLDTAINNYFSQNKKEINFMVISHLHRDHYNGLQKLINNGVRISKLYIPYIYDNVFGLNTSLLLNLAYNYLFESDMGNLNDYYNFTLALYRGNIDGVERVICRYEETDNGDFAHGQLSYYDSYNDYWKFDFYNNVITIADLQNIINGINALLTSNSCQPLSNIQVQDFINFINNNAVAVRNVYDNILKKNSNFTSIMLAHYPIYGGIHGMNFFFNNLCYNCLVNRGILRGEKVSILTGDVELTNPMLTVLNSNYNKQIGVLQIPHHGALNESKQLISNHINISPFYIVSFGLGNNYHHPSASLINTLINSSNLVVGVNQINYFSYEVF